MLAHRYSPEIGPSRSDDFPRHFLRNLQLLLFVCTFCAIFIVFAICIKGSYPTHQSTCSPGYTFHFPSQKCYKIFQTLETFHVAYGECLQESGLVASIHSPETNDFLSDLYNNTKPLENVKLEQFWIGLTMISGNWSWVDGEGMEYTNWAAGMPGENSTGKSVVMDLGNDNEKRDGNSWKVIGREEQRAFACEKLTEMM